jgi:hypothetical protein
MLNHSVAGDVTLGHYVGKSEAQLRAGWQTVADYIEAAALETVTQNEWVLRRLLAEAHSLRSVFHSCAPI